MRYLYLRARVMVMTESRFRTVCSLDDFYVVGMTGPQADAVTLDQSGAGDEFAQVTTELLG